MYIIIIKEMGVDREKRGGAHKDGGIQAELG